LASRLCHQLIIQSLQVPQVRYAPFRCYVSAEQINLFSLDLIATLIGEAFV